MKLQPVAVLRRAATLELQDGDDAFYYAARPYTITVNGETRGSGDKNVFSLFRLTPSMYYDVEVRTETGETARCSFVTPAETMYLNATAFGAVGDGGTDCTGAIQAALAACAPGGTVCLPEGVYLSGPLFLREDVLLYLDRGAVLLGSAERGRYPVLPGMVAPEVTGGEEVSFGTWEGNPLDCHAALLTGIAGKQIAVAGEGAVDGNAGQAGWWADGKNRETAWRPRTLFFVRCEDVTVLGVRIQNSPSWTIHPYYCKNVDVLDVTIHNPPDSPNTDGCNPESCENVRILGTHISVGDDCIAVKSGKYYMGTCHFAPSRNILVRNCLLERGHGAVVLGSEISAGVHGLLVERCLLRNTDRGLRIKTRRGRGADSIISGVEFSHVRMENVQTPFVVNMFYYCDPDGHSDYVRDKEPRPVDAYTPSIQNIHCHDVTCTGCEHAGVYFYGLPERPVGRVRLENISIAFAPNAGSGLPAMMDDAEPVSRLALFMANVERLELDNVSFAGDEGERYRLYNVARVTSRQEQPAPRI